MIKKLGKSFEDVLHDDQESLQIFLRGMAKLNDKFCNGILSGNDFTIRLEVHGNKNKLIHTRVYEDDIERPNKAGNNHKT